MTTGGGVGIGGTMRMLDGMNTGTRCRYCGETFDNHCSFEPMVMPKGCICDPGTWESSEEVTSPCGEHWGTDKQYCQGCGHDAGCHRT